MIRFTGSHCHVRVPNVRSDVKENTRIVISFVGPKGLRILGLVGSVRDNTYIIEILRIVHKDKRDYARVCSEVRIRYHVITERDSVAQRAAWEQGLEDVSAFLEWQTPNKHVNFSRSGMQLLHTNCCVVGNRVLLEVGFLESKLNHRLSGIVVRVDEISEEMQKRSFDSLQQKSKADTHAIAIKFQTVNHEVEEAFSRATVEQQIREISLQQGNT
ncbi:MAG: hypothetical protein VYC39_13435 [Myxococcota bacterium]|nr:hypothetical protein [Myxococcota bacterium]